jgi:gliding motility-associated-like protein
MADGQTCQGGLGDPIVNISFGRGAGPGPPLAPGITNLEYVTNPCPSDGQYTLVSYTSGCHRNTWMTVKHDHTGDNSGYFMLINASFTPSDFYVQTINGLCGGTSYQFAAWLMNVGYLVLQIRPNVTFRIEKTDGTVLQSFNTGDIPIGATWRQYAFYFDTPPGVGSVVIRMINNAQGGPGNDLALDDISFRAAGPLVTTSVAGYNTRKVSVCDGAVSVLHLTSAIENNCYPSVVYQWQESVDAGNNWKNIAGANAINYDLQLGGYRTLSVSQNPPGTYQYRMTVAEATNAGIKNCTVAGDPVTISIVPRPRASVSISSSAYGCEGQPQLYAAAAVNGGPGPLFQWKLNGFNTGAGDSTFTLPAPVSTDVVNCVMTSNETCVSNPVVVSNSITVPVEPVPVTGVDMTASADHICEDSLVVFGARPSNGGAAPSYAWLVNGKVADSSGPVYATRSLRNGDVVGLAMKGSLTCSQVVRAPSTVTMTVWDAPTIAMVSDTVIAPGASLLLAPVLTGNIVTYAWSPATGLSDAGSPRTVARPAVTTGYRLDVTTVDGCRASSEVKVGVYYDTKMPGAFTPNGDGHNDLFRVPPVVPVHIRRLSVFNRAGAMLFSTENVGVGWDGTVDGIAQPVGTYVWEVEFENPVTHKEERRRGAVVLLR